MNVMATPIRVAEIKDVRGYKLPETYIDGFVRTTTHRHEDTAQRAAALAGDVTFILTWKSEVGNDVFALYVTDAVYLARRDAKIARSNALLASKHQGR